MASAMSQEINGTQIGKEEIKLSLVADDMTAYLEKLIKNIKKPYWN